MHNLETVLVFQNEMPVVIGLSWMKIEIWLLSYPQGYLLNKYGSEKYGDPLAS